MKKLLLLFTITFITALSVNAQDVIRLKNGNELNGEVKSMDKGVLVIETPYSDSDFKVEWNQVSYINTESQYIISLSKAKMASLMMVNDTLGDRISSRLISDPNNSKRVILKTKHGNRSVSLSQIVYLKSFNDSFLSRLSASIDVGFNVTKSNNLRQVNISSSLGYLADKWGANAGFNVVNSVQDSIARVHRLDANLGFNWYLPKDFYLAISTSFLENDELQLDLRSTIKAGFGFFIFRTNELYLKVEGGVAYNNEQYFESPDIDIDPNPRRSEEGYIGTELNLFDIGDLNLMSSLTVFPSLSESGRVRSDFKFEAKYDLPFDLYIKAGTTVNYDNRPAVEGGEYDYVINTGLGWEL
jgi:hypothetical protein